MPSASPPIQRVWHDNIFSSRINTKLEHWLNREITKCFNEHIIPALRTNVPNNIETARQEFSSSYEPFMRASYYFGSQYASEVAGKPNDVSADKHYEVRKSLAKEYDSQFIKKVSGLMAIQQTENRRGYQVVASEKERLSSELSALIAWKSFNQGIKTKGQELKEDLKKYDRTGIMSVPRRIRLKDMKTEKFQKVIVGRRLSLDKERTSAVKKVELDLKIGDLEGDVFGEMFRADRFYIVYTFVTMKDEKVCEFCRGLEAEGFWDLDSPDVPDPPVHSSCRCRLAYAEILGE